VNNTKFDIQNHFQFQFLRRALVVWSRRSLAMLKVRSSILRAGNNNVLVTKSDWPTLVGSVCYASLVSASTDRDFKPGSKYWNNNTA